VDIAGNTELIRFFQRIAVVQRCLCCIGIDYRNF
jgi:hypothetical protein